MSGEERLIINASLHSMIQCLDDAVHLSSDPPDAPPLQTSFHVHTGNAGRPSIHIPPSILATALELRGPTHLASVFNCSARTVRRRALEHGLAEPGPPVYIKYEHGDGSTFKFYGGGNDPLTELSDDDLDEITSQIIELFPNFGRRMIDGHLRHLGHHVPRSRVQESYARVHGAPASSFGPRRIQRRVYSVPGPNSLAHHDGQHGMSKFSLLCQPFLTCSSWQVLSGGKLSSMLLLMASHVLSLVYMLVTTIGQRLSFLSFKTSSKSMASLVVFVETME